MSKVRELNAEEQALKDTHFFILDSVSIYGNLQPVAFLWPLYRNRFGERSVAPDIFEIAHDTIKECISLFTGQRREA